MKAPLAHNEIARLKALYTYAILDSDPEQAYTDITKIASYIAGTPISLISLVDRDRQWFKAKVGLDANETPRDMAFCAHAILDPDKPLVVTDATKDQRFADNPLVTGDPNIRFYFGVPLTTSNHMALGTLCVIDRVARTLSPKQSEALQALARQTVALLELRQRAADMRQAAADQLVFLDQLEAYQRDLEKANNKLRDHTLVDNVTSSGNRTAFDKRLQEDIGRAKRFSSPLSLLLVQIDDFKKISAAQGQVTSDACLQTIASALRCIRPSDFLARIGNDQFAILLPTIDVDRSCTLAERIRSAVASISFLFGNVTVSIGISTMTNDKIEDYPLLNEGENALKAAQQARHNRVIHADLIKEMAKESYVII